MFTVISTTAGELSADLNITPKRHKQVVELCQGFARARRAAKSRAGAWPPGSSKEPLKAEAAPRTAEFHDRLRHKELAGLETKQEGL